jgi:carbon storage regulator CsrA
MLVLTRKNKESIFIKVKNDDGTEETIKIQVVGTGKLVRLGIEAPKKYPIFREELLEKVGEVVHNDESALPLELAI